MELITKAEALTKLRNAIFEKACDLEISVTIIEDKLTDELMSTDKREELKKKLEATETQFKEYSRWIEIFDKKLAELKD